MSRVLEELKSGLYVCRSEIHSFGTDAFLLTSFSGYRQRDLVCDLGTGCGIIPLLMQRCKPPKQIYAVDIQADAIEQLQEGIAHCDCAPAITPVCCDLRELKDMPFGQFDLVTCNPPYMIGNHGITNPEAPKAIARHEILCTFEDVAGAAEKLLKSGGKFFLVHRPFRLAEIIVTLTKHKLEPKRMRLVYPFADKEPNMVLIEAVRGVKCDYSVQSLLNKGFIEEQGRRETLGRPILYGTTDKFLQHFGMETLADLPAVEALSPEGEIGI